MSEVDDRNGNSVLGTYVLGTQAFSVSDMSRSLNDQALLNRGKLNDTNVYCRTVPHAPSQGGYIKLSKGRDDLDYREWNSETGFIGTNRWPAGPGMTGHAKGDLPKTPLKRRDIPDDGF